MDLNIERQMLLIKPEPRLMKLQQILCLALAFLWCLYFFLPQIAFAWGGCSQIINHEAADIRRIGVFGVFALCGALILFNIGTGNTSKLSRILHYFIWGVGMLLLFASSSLFVTTHGLRMPVVAEYIVTMDLRVYFTIIALWAFCINRFQHRPPRAWRKVINRLIGWAAVSCLLLYSVINFQYFGTLREPRIEFNDFTERIESGGHWVCPPR